MRLLPCAIAIVAAALYCAARVGAAAQQPVVPVISVVQTPPAPPVEVPAVAFDRSAAERATPYAPRFSISAGDEAARTIRVSGITGGTPAEPPSVSPDAEAVFPAGTMGGDGDRPRQDAPSISFSVPGYHATPADRDTVAACLVLEAASQGEFGMQAVMAVIRNRARGLPELFVPTVLQAKQFSALNRVTAGRESLAVAIGRAQRDRMWPLALAIVDRAMEDSWSDPTDGATHYTRTGERTRWTRSLAKTTTIGAHSFYR